MNWEIIRELSSWACLIAGSFFCIAGAVGMLRLPDFFTRIHAASVVDSLGAGLILFGLALQAGWSTTLLKIVLTFAFMLLTGPTAVHAIAKSAIYDGYKPKLATKDDAEEQL